MRDCTLVVLQVARAAHRIHLERRGRALRIAQRGEEGGDGAMTMSAIALAHTT